MSTVRVLERALCFLASEVVEEIEKRQVEVHVAQRREVGVEWPQWHTAEGEAELRVVVSHIQRKQMLIGRVLFIFPFQSAEKLTSLCFRI